MRVEQPLRVYVDDLAADPSQFPEWLGDIVALGGTVTAATILAGYATGTFPMDVGLAEDDDDDDDGDDECPCDECAADEESVADDAGAEQVGTGLGAPAESAGQPQQESQVAPVSSGRSVLAWWSPLHRGVLPLTALRVHRSLAKSVRRYHTTVDRDFDEVLHECSDPRDNEVWIRPDFIDAYRELHKQGHAHSVETRDDAGRLVGGLICVEQGGLVNGDSMFYRERDASKVALVELVRILRAAPAAPGLPAWCGGRLLDVQWVTPHLARLGAVKITRREYVHLLPAALTAEPAFGAAR